MDRRTFLSLAGAAGAALGGAGLFRHLQEITPAVRYPGRAEGHYLRDASALPPPSRVIDTDIVILGSGVAGISAAWKLRREGHPGALVIDGPQPYGNAAGGRSGDLAYPTGAHYLPLPTMESTHVREILAALGMIRSGAFEERPFYDERCLLHAPHERVLAGGAWQDGLLPTEGVPPSELEEHKRFHAEMARLRATRGSDGKPLFALPSVASSADARWRALDRITFAQWLDRERYDAPTLRWYLDYCCRDDYGAGIGRVSAWAGLHYFASRSAGAANAEDGTSLTWPGGLQPLVEAMAQSSGMTRMAGTAARVRTVKGRAEALCFTLEDGRPRTFLVRARKAICAMPLFVAARVVEDIGALGFTRDHLPEYAPWLVANFLMKRLPRELPHAPLAWDNVVYGTNGLGYVVSTHQDIRATPPDRTVFTAYVALADHTPAQARKWMMSASAQGLLDVAAADLEAAYGWRFGTAVERAEITLRAHAMAIPQPGFLGNAGIRALRSVDGPLLFAHADLTGFSVFEEASWWGFHAASLALKHA